MNNDDLQFLGRIEQIPSQAMEVLSLASKIKYSEHVLCPKRRTYLLLEGVY